MPWFAKLKNGPNEYSVLGERLKVHATTKHVVKWLSSNGQGGDRGQENKPKGLMLGVGAVMLQTSSHARRRRFFCLSGGDQLKQYMGRGKRPAEAAGKEVIQVQSHKVRLNFHPWWEQTCT